VKQLPKVTLLAAALCLSACSILQSNKVDYRSTSKAPELDIPPDLTQLSKETRYSVVNGGVSASSLQTATPATTKTTLAATTLGDVRVERAGNQRWLVVNRPADKLWEPVKDFWQENGFVLTLDQSALGIMETDWAENRAKIPLDSIRSVLGKVFDSLYSTPERDKFRTRLERSSDNTTDIFISHRGMMEVYVNEAKDETTWQPRPADPELEAEFLRRLMLKLGVTPEEAKTLVAAASNPKNIASIVTANNLPAVRIDEGFDRAWRRVGLALDRTGFSVEDRDRKQGIYFVRYVPPNSNVTEPGFFGKLFGKTPEAVPATKYQIAVRSEGEKTLVTVLNTKGETEASANAQRILKILAEDIK
jgi:outer membrane protein assembly factor BamC